MPVSYEWRGSFCNAEVNGLHAEAFETRLYTDDEWNWIDLVTKDSLGWIVARDDGCLVGFVNVVWDGFTHDMGSRLDGRHCGSQPGHQHPDDRDRTVGMPGSWM
jgi:hypothetical protein